MKGIDCRTLSRMFGNIHDWLICRITALLYYALLCSLNHFFLYELRKYGEHSDYHRRNRLART
jgi:succinate dehydrogenase hydrophobic anchor subunit